MHNNKHNEQTQAKLRNLTQTNPKEFWKTINNLEPKNDDPNRSLETLHEYFKKKLNTNGNETDNLQDDINIGKRDDDEILNSSITEGEILKCIKALKNNKSSANDRILNEYIKNSTDVLLPVYVSLFNLILDTGYILLVRGNY